MPRPKLPLTPDGKPLTTQRSYRFDTQLFEAFEADCRKGLRNPNPVLSALVDHWLDACAAERERIAAKLPGGVGDGEQ
jgi:hypothetical protein